MGFPGGTVVKNPPANAGAPGDTGSIPGSGRSPREGHGNPLKYSCLGNFMDRRVWRATVHGVARSQTQLSIHTCTHTFVSVPSSAWQHRGHYARTALITRNKSNLVIVIFACNLACNIWDRWFIQRVPPIHVISGSTDQVLAWQHSRTSVKLSESPNLITLLQYFRLLIFKPVVKAVIHTPWSREKYFDRDPTFRMAKKENCKCIVE